MFKKALNPSAYMHGLRLSASTMVQETKEAPNFYFCYRWLLILFKREFSTYEEASLLSMPTFICAHTRVNACST